MAITVVVHVRGKPGTAGDLLQAMSDIGKVRISEPAFGGGTHYVDSSDPEHIIEVQIWDSRETHQAFMAKIGADFHEAFALLAGPPNVTYADEL